MTTGLELLGSQLEHSVLELMHPHISQVLRMIFNPKDQFNTVSSKEFDEQISKISERSILTQDLDMIRQLPLFTEAEISSPGESFGGFRLDSTMKNTIKTVMHINESRNQAYRVHFNEKEAARKARDRAERKVSEEREKQLQRVHQMTRKNGSSSSKDMSMIRRKSYRAAHAKALHGSSFTSTSSAHNVSSA
jgi:hypothetical protein